MDEVLAELKAVYTLYSPLWDRWRISYECTLPEDVIYFIDAQVNSGFIIDIGNVMFYNKLPVLQAVTENLKANYPKFQKWAIARFISSLIWRGIHYDAEVFFCTGINHLNISAELKQRLENFGVKNLSSLLKLSPRHVLNDPVLFKLIVDAEVVFCREGKALRMRKGKEVRKGY